MDERLRKLERSAQQGDPDAQSRHLKDRVRSGEISEPEIKVAALLGDRASARMLGVEEEPVLTNQSKFQDWVNRLLVQAVPRTEERFSIALARAVLAQGMPQAPLIAALDTSESFLLGVEPRERLQSADDDLESVDLGNEENNFEGIRPYRVVKRAVDVCLGTAMPSDRDFAISSASATRAFSSLEHPTARRDDPQTWAKMQAAIQVELLPWVLHERDPLQERLRARESAKHKIQREQQADEVRQRLDEQHPQQ